MTNTFWVCSVLVHLSRVRVLLPSQLAYTKQWNWNKKKEMLSSLRYKPNPNDASSSWWMKLCPFDVRFWLRLEFIFSTAASRSCKVNKRHDTQATKLISQPLGLLLQILIDRHFLLYTFDEKWCAYNLMYGTQITECAYTNYSTGVTERDISLYVTISVLKPFFCWQA